ncbi:MAG: VWA domain-containing protein [Oscillospiraceae bacterium]|nr:VWA domain-containing protein [Oscillospiraceae bacterium]
MKKHGYMAYLLAFGLLTGCASSTNPSYAPAATTVAPAEAYSNDSYTEATTYRYYEEAAVCETESAEYYDDNFNTEEYSAIKENSYKSTVTEPLSTFSIDVDTASYSNVRRMINNGRSVPPDAVRIEEFINYFKYSYPEPVNGQPFSVTAELSDCPWNDEAKLMRVGIKAKDIDYSGRKPMNLVFLVDVSGSMFDDDKLPLVQRSFTILADQLTPADRVSIVTYAGSDRIVLDGADSDDRQEILAAIDSLQAGGSTNGAAGIETAYRLASDHFIDGGINRIILATDGDLNVGVTSESELKELVEEKRKSGVYLSVFGFGEGNIKDNKMETLADNGNGNYYYIDSEREARKVLVEEMNGTLVSVAKDVKLQIEFNPAYIKGYRQVGYENRALAAEDFADDTKDAGEIGAGHTVTALYEVIFNDSSKEFSSGLKYSDNDTVSLGKENGELLTISVRYKEPDGNESKLLEYPINEGAYSPEMSSDMQFAASVAEFGMLLRDSEYKGTATREQLLDMIHGCDIYDDEYKTEFAHLAEMADIRS